MSVPCVILAAGLSSRMGQPKALLPLGKSSFLSRLIETCLTACRPVVVVLGKDAAEIRKTLPGHIDVVPVVNENYELGMLSSLQVGLRAAPAGEQGIVFTLVDHPRLRTETLQAVVAHLEESGAPVVIARFQGKRGHPVAISPAVVEELLQAPPTGSPKDVIRAHFEATIFVDLDDAAIVEDIDTPAEYEQLRGTEGT